MSPAFRLPTSCFFAITYAPPCVLFHATRLEFSPCLIKFPGPPGRGLSRHRVPRISFFSVYFFFSLLLPARVLGVAGTRMDVATDRGTIFV